MTLRCEECSEPIVRAGEVGRPPRFCRPCVKVRHLAQARAYVQRKPDQRRQSRIQWAEQNVDALRTARKAWKRANPEAVRQSRREVKRRHPELNRSYVSARRARQRHLTVVPFTPQQLFARLAYYGGRCWMCRAEADSLDHVKPLAKGGAHMLCNLRPACRDCNTRKSDRWPLDVFRAS